MENTQSAFRLVSRLKLCEQEKEALKQQVEELKEQLQSAGCYSVWQEGKTQMTQAESLQKQVEELTDKLLQEQEAARAVSNELEKSREELVHQRRLTEEFANKEKETRDQLERLKSLSDPATLDTLRIALKVGNDIKKMHKKVLQREYEELKVALIISQEKFCTELQAERDQRKTLIEQLKASTENNRRYITLLKAEREKRRDVRKELRRELLSHADSVARELEAITLLKDQRELVQQKDEEIQVLIKNTSEKDKELEDLRDKLRDWAWTNQELQAGEEVSPGLQTEPTELQGEQQEDTPSVLEQMRSFWRTSPTRERYWRRRNTLE